LNISHVWISNSSANDHGDIASTINGTFISSHVRNHFSCKYEYVGINKLSLSHLIAFSGNTDIGCVHIENTVVKITRAIKKLAVTHHSKIIIFFRKLADIKLSGAVKSAVSVGSSHLSLQNHQRGITFAVYSVHFLSFQSLQIFGGIQIQNSNTFTHDFLDAIKCHNSCNTTRIININTQMMMDKITIFFHTI
jgi:hypothetical protein